MHCTQCGVEGEGRFCSACGASLVDMSCPSCEADLPRGSRFCNECGSPAQRRDPVVTGAGPGAGNAPVAWAVAGILLVGLLAVAAFPIFSSGDGAPRAGAPPPGALGPAPNVDLASMTPREAADRLYERIAVALSARDTTEVLNFLPMALDAYEIARPLDTDGLFHLALLQRVALDFEASLATAQEGLEMDPNHLLHLSAAAEASREMGRMDEAASYYRRLLEAWEVESQRDLEDYEEHARLLPVIRQEAQEFLEGG
ncbi:MAG: hypothetical protein EA421_13900 [Gemmatimonadales bacterium]|nr:MAG: hypothetical protein EA421_13900 [Gemmatimonadales bacterium]